MVSSGLADVGSREDAWPGISIEVPTSHGEAASASAATTLGTDRIGWMGNVAPMRRQGSGMAYDSHADRVVLFGGYNEAGSFSDDTWTYDFNTNTWANMEPAAGPLARRLPAMAYDSDSDRVILFGGYGWGGNYDDTWAYDFNTNTWTSMNPTAKPTSTLQAMAYDSQSDRAILFGGASYVDPQNTTWAYDFNTNNWTNMQPVSQPLASYGHAMAYDSASDRVIVFGGVDRNGSALNETWAYDFNTNNWTNLNPVSKLPTRLYHAMAYDSQSDRVILVGGYTQSGQPDYDIWAYDFNANTWTSMDPLDKPRARVYHSMAYDFQSDRVILFGGSDFIQGAVLNDTWAYDLESNTWTYMATRPPGRFEHAMAYDSASDRVILFGGIVLGSGLALNDTWAYDLESNTWTYMAANPPARYGHAMAYDSQSDRVILFGGTSPAASGAYLADTWAYDFANNTWTNMDPASKPPARSLHLMAYDSQSDRVILFGGAGIGVLLNDTWAYDFNTNNWTNMGPISKPAVQLYDAMAYDSQSDRMILFGGTDRNGPVVNQTWTYDFNNNTWTDMDPVSKPPARLSHALAYDSQSDRVILFGGSTQGGLVLNDTWAYDFESNGWMSMTSKPPALSSHAMAYDSQSDRVILFGGYTQGGLVLDDTWAYDLNANAWTNVDAPLPLSAPQALRATSGNAQVTLTWVAPFSNGGSPITGYSVYHGTSSGSLTLLSSLGDVLTYQDPGLTNGITYYYQVSAYTAAGEGPRSSEVAATPRTQPSAARNLVATPGAARVVLMWDAPISDGGGAVTAYSIYRGTVSARSTLLTTGGNGLTYTDDAVTNGVTYYYQTAALNIAGEGPRSNEVSATPNAPADSTPPAATIVSLSNGTVVNSTTLTLTGTASDNVAIEKVEVSTDGTTWILATGTTSWSATLTLKEGSNTVFVRTTDTSGNADVKRITVTVEQANVAQSGTRSLTVDRVAGGAIVTAAVAVGVYVSSAASAGGASSTSSASGSLTGKRMWLPWKQVLRFLRRRKRGAAQLQVDDRLYRPSSRRFETPNVLFAQSKGVLRPSKVLADVAPSLGLKTRGPWLFGRYRGFPVVAKESSVSDKYELLFQVALTREAVKGVRAAIADQERVKSLGLQAAGLRIESSVGELVYDHRPIVRTKPANVALIFEGLAILAKAGGPPLGDRCEKCRQNPAGDVIVVNGLPTQLCPEDFNRVHGGGEASDSVDKGLRPSYAKGLGLGLVGMFLGAGIWAAIGIVTGYVLSLAAFGISVLIANLLAKGAKRVTLPLTGLMLALTMVAIFLGDVLWIGVAIVHVRGPLDLWQGVEAYVKIVRTDPYVLISYASGFLGILGTLASMRRRARRARASLEVIG